ncbi:unnamed protein product [Cyprideis torosa]|uniref:Uncharacterized protein n=1 Tax=Cyprideis torosa TaxID=163714 RepID=A0A7R8ZP17_9CRUS|nr:unnamed protein product [Cyprideis torosa]CAG0887592.1 unnamed protein product [Cyprideis torosa]
MASLRLTLISILLISFGATAHARATVAHSLPAEHRTVLTSRVDIPSTLESDDANSVEEEREQKKTFRNSIESQELPSNVNPRVCGVHIEDHFFQHGSRTSSAGLFTANTTGGTGEKLEEDPEKSYDMTIFSRQQMPQGSSLDPINKLLSPRGRATIPGRRPIWPFRPQRPLLFRPQRAMQRRNFIQPNSVRPRILPRMRRPLLTPRRGRPRAVIPRQRLVTRLPGGNPRRSGGRDGMFVNQGFKTPFKDHFGLRAELIDPNSMDEDFNSIFKSNNLQLGLAPGSQGQSSASGSGSAGEGEGGGYSNGFFNTPEQFHPPGVGEHSNGFFHTPEQFQNPIGTFNMQPQYPAGHFSNEFGSNNHDTFGSNSHNMGSGSGSGYQEPDYGINDPSLDSLPMYHAEQQDVEYHGPYKLRVWKWTDKHGGSHESWVIHRYKKKR